MPRITEPLPKAVWVGPAPGPITQEALDAIGRPYAGGGICIEVSGPSITLNGEPVSELDAELVSIAWRCDPRIPASASGGELNFGWGDEGAKIQTALSFSKRFDTGRTFAVTYRDDVMSWEYFKDETGADKARSVWTHGEPYEVQHAEQAEIVVNRVSYNSWYKTYQFQQVRRETVDLVLDVECQPFSLSAETLDLGPIQLGDVNNLEGVEPYAEGVAYNKGDRVLVHGRVYLCLADRVTAFYVARTRVRNGVPTTTFTTPYWTDLGTSTPMGNPASPSYFDGIRGQLTIATMLNRMRAAALKRLCSLQISKVFPWDVARDLRITDSIQFQIRDGDNGTMTVRGTVEELRHVIDGSGQAFVQVTITPPLGTGANDKVNSQANSYAESDAFDNAYSSSYIPEYVSTEEIGYKQFGNVGDDIEYVMVGSKLFEPVRAMKLYDPSYSVLSVLISNSGEEQIARATELISDGRSPEYVAQEYPTTVDVAMRPLRNEGNIQRQYSLQAQLTWSPKGMDLGGDQ